MAYYSKEIMKHFLRPEHLGEIKNPDAVGDTENLKCGDIMRLYLKISQRAGQKFIKEIKFTTLGCGTAIAAADMTCALAKGKTLAQAQKIDYSQILKKMGQVPAQKIHCAQLAERALKIALADYERKQSLPKKKYGS